MGFTQFVGDLHLPVFPTEGRGRDYPRKLDSFEKVESNSLPMLHTFVSKNPQDVPPKLDIISSRDSS